MKVKELIEQLQKHNPESIVVVDGYETGFDELKKVEYIAGLKKLPEDKAYYDGEYQEAATMSWLQDLTTAVYLPRSS
jgi:ABC-type Fe3+-hydroxamate transport system substrate-binding protein